MSQPKYYGLNELREMFLHFFETKGHLPLLQGKADILQNPRPAESLLDILYL